MNFPESLGATRIPHKADNSFFLEKRPWSTRKDRILGSYLAAYLPKIAKVGVPVLIVDGFSGPGRFGDGEPGSPLIICQAIKKASETSRTLTARAICIESDPALVRQLRATLGPFSFAQPRHGTFLDFVGEIEKLAASHTTFLYLDPWTVDGLEWAELDRILEHVSSSRRSVELLLNFNAPSFVRRALSALRLAVPDVDPTFEDVEPLHRGWDSEPSLARLNEVMGSNAWEGTLRAESLFAAQVGAMAKLVCANLRKRFREVGMHGVKACPQHKVPKYYLIFASRHVDALLLMNDEFVKSQRTLADEAKPDDPTFFELRSEELVPDIGAIPTLVRSCLTGRRPRKDTIADVVREAFGKYLRKDIRGAIQGMLKSGEILSASGKTRINEDEVIWLAKTM